jgi:hypothetical protein
MVAKYYSPLGLSSNRSKVESDVIKLRNSVKVRFPAKTSFVIGSYISAGRRAVMSASNDALHAVVTATVDQMESEPEPAE